MTQTEQVLNHLQHNGSISPLEAIKDYGIMRLGARIWDMKHMGYTILRVPETRPNRFGKPTTYARYVLMPDATADTKVSA